MKQLILIFSAAVLAMLFVGCKTPEEWQQQTNQRTYDKIVKQGQDTINQNQQKMMFQNQ
jgi:hypothetical protein